MDFFFSYFVPFLFNSGTNKNIKFNGQKGENLTSFKKEERFFNGIGSSDSKGLIWFLFAGFFFFIFLSSAFLLCSN